MNWITAFSIAGIMQGIFSLVLFNTRGRRFSKSNSLLILMVMLTLTARVFYDTGFLYKPQLALFSDTLLFIYGPMLLWLFDQYYNSRVATWKLVPHFLPAFVHTLSLVILISWREEDYRQMLQDGGLNIYFMTVSVLANLHLLCYVLVVWRKDVRGRDEVDKKSWQPLFWILGLVVLLWMAANIEALARGSVLSNIFFQTIWILLSLVIYLITYWFFFGITMFPTKKKTTNKVDLQAFEYLLKSEHKYLDAEIRLPDIAQQLGTNTLFLSQAINRTYKCTFPEYVNRMRIEKFEELAQLQENANLTHWALAQQAGFHSKSAFYRAYKREKHSTPAKRIKPLAS